MANCVSLLKYIHFTLGAHRVGGLWAVFFIRFIFGGSEMQTQKFQKRKFRFSSRSLIRISNFFRHKFCEQRIYNIWVYLIFGFAFELKFEKLWKTYRTKPALDPLCPPLSARRWGCWCIIIILILTICLREIKTRRARSQANISKTNKRKQILEWYIYIYR